MQDYEHIDPIWRPKPDPDLPNPGRTERRSKPREWKGGTPRQAIGSLVVSFAGGAWITFATWKLYSWFAVPLGAPWLSFVHIWGLSVLLDLIILTYMPPRESTDLGRVIKYGTVKIVVAAIFLLTGWILSWWM